MKVCRKIVLLAFVSLYLISATLGTSFITQATYEQTTSDPVDPFPQAGKFYTLAGRTVGWVIVDGKNTTTHDEEIIKWSVQDVVGDVAFVNRTYVDFFIHSETGGNWTTMTDYDCQIATNRTILSAHQKQMRFTTAGFQWSASLPLDEDVGEHTWAWFPTDLYIGAYVLASWTTDNTFLDDMLYEVVDEEVIQILGEKQDCWMVRMSPTITIDGTRVCTETFWVDKDTGVLLKLAHKSWALDVSFGWEGEYVLVNTNIDLGPESTEPPSPTYTLTVPTTPGFPEAGKFYTWYYPEDGWYMNGATNVTWYADALFSWWVFNVTDDEVRVCRIMWYDRVCEAEGVEELEAVDILYFSYRVNKTTREILDATGSSYAVNMTSLTHVGPADLTPLLAGDIGEETYCWLPTNLYIGASVNISFTFDRPWKVDNATYTVIDEEIIRSLGEPQACWVLYLPSTPSIDGTWNYSETYYFDKDTGIPLRCVGEGWAVDGNSTSEYILQLIDTNVDLGAPSDTTPPVIMILSPENKTYATSSVPLNFTIDETTSWIGYSLDGQTNETITGNKTLSGLLDGSHYVVVYANDTAGNMGSSSTIYFTVDTTPPNITNVSQTPLENNVLPEDEVKVNATVTDDLSGVKQVTLNYTNGNGTWITVETTNLEGAIWNGTIPAFPYCTNVTYVIIAEDNANNTITTEEMEYNYQYHVIPEFPSFLILPLFMIATLLTVIVYRRRKHSM